MEAYVGRYGLGPEATAKVWVERGRLRVMEFAPDVLIPVAPDVFFCRQCHQDDEFHFEERLPRIAHPRPEA
jgi:hypothetical protein